jgi:FkbM family methyltransferase
MQTFQTDYGKITLYKNDCYIADHFRKGKYWDIDKMLKLRQYIDPSKNILEIGGHCGTSSVVYASFLNDDKKIFVYEPQRNLFELLVQNINQNGLQEKIVPHNLGVFCFTGEGTMNGIDLDGGKGEVAKRYEEEKDLNCNFGGICLGSDGEKIQLTTIDEMKLDNIGYIHCDAQGAETFIFSKGTETIKAQRPVILYENNARFAKYLCETVHKAYPQYETEGAFDLKKYCMEELKYTRSIMFGCDELLLP